MIRYNLILLCLLFTPFQGKSQSIGAETSYFYQSNQHTYPTQIESTRSDGNKEITIITYPQDYAPGYAFIDTLVARRFYSYPIEKVTLIKIGNDMYVTAARIVRYDTSKAYRESELSLESVDPIPLSSYKFSNRNTAGQLPFSGAKDIFSPDSRYKAYVTYDSYTTNGRLLQKTSLGGISSCYMYDYNNQYKVAEVQNAKLQDVAYSSFDSPDSFTGGWVFNEYGIENDIPFTGGYSYDVSIQPISKSGLNPDRTYQLTYWRLQSCSVDVFGGTILSVDSIMPKMGDRDGNWGLFKYLVKGASEITLSNTSGGNMGIIDELRLCPLESSMTTYLYGGNYSSVGFRLSDAGDSEGQFLRYEYDSQGRVTVIRDSFQNTVEATKYQLLH